MQIPPHVIAIHEQRYIPKKYDTTPTPKLSIQDMQLIDVEELLENHDMNKQYILVQVYQVSEDQHHLIVRDFNEIWLNVTIIAQNQVYQVDDCLIIKNPKLCEYGIMIFDCQDVVPINIYTYMEMINNPQNIDPLNLKIRANQYYSFKQYRLAYEVYTMVLKQNNIDNQLLEQCYNNRAQCTYLLGYIQESISDTNQVLTLNENNLKAKYRKASSLLRLQSHEEAKQLLESIPEYQSDKEIVFKIVECELFKRHSSGDFDLMLLLDQFLNHNESKFEKINRYMNKNIERKQSPLGGLGLFATSNIQKGTLLLVERPLHNIQSKSALLGIDQRDEIITDLRQRALNDKLFAETLFSLYDGSNKTQPLKFIKKDFEYQLQNYVVDYERIENILQYNSHAFQMIKVFTKNKQIKYLDQTEGLWFTLSQMNHSLTPNIFYYFIGELLIVVSARDIQQGEEILVQYHPPLNQKEYQANLKSHKIPIDQQLVKHNQLWKMDEDYNEIKTIIKDIKKSKNLDQLTTYTLNNQEIIQQIKQKYPIKYLKIIQTVCYYLFSTQKIKEYLDLKFDSLKFQFETYPQCSTIQDFCMFLTVLSQEVNLNKEIASFIFKIGILLFGQAFLKNQNSEELLFAYSLKQIKN